MAEPAIETRFVEANGLRFEVDCCGDGDRLALALHGFPECAYSWRLQLPLLARLGYRVWAPNQRGYGRSSRPSRIEDYAIEHLLDDVAGLIDAAGCRETVLLGHDWGAVVAWFFAMRKLRPIDRLVIMNVPHPATFLTNRSVRQMLRSWYALFFQIPRLPELLLRPRAIGRAFVGGAVNKERFGPEVQRVYQENASHPGAVTAMINWYRALVRGGGAKRQQDLGFPRIEIPTLMIWGVRDVALGIETTFGTERHVDDLTLRYPPNASHWVQQEDPETVNEMLEAWLTGKPVPLVDGGAFGAVGSSV